MEVYKCTQHTNGDIPVVTDTHDLTSYLAQFGLNEFRPGQEDVIRSVLAGEDCLCIMPTGGGKSLCYQLPSVVRNGTTLVLSPLIALMKDQVDGLSELGLRATSINSSLSMSEQFDRIAAMRDGEYDLVYIAPERLRSPRFQDAIGETDIQLLAVDEAHCISEWGHDFRPDYARIGEFRESLGQIQTIALTATATPLVREDVIKQLGLGLDARTWITGFARPNLRFSVQVVRSQDQKQSELLKFLRRTPGNGIIYAATRKRCEELVPELQSALGSKDGRAIGVYHAGLLPETRRSVQESFMAGETQVIIATNAFGMGIDKSDLRFVVHYNAPGSIEAYYQEAGRAGRDGEDSECLLLFSPADRYIQEFFIQNAYPPVDVIAKVYQFLRSQDTDPIEVTQQTIKEQLSLSVGNEAVSASERILEKSGALERISSRQNMAAVRIESDLPTLVDLLPKDAKAQRKALRALERIVGQRRYERVFFTLARVLDQEELDRNAWNRAMKHVGNLAAVDYVPPFRGRAVHLLQRDKAFGELTIDFEQFEKRKQQEYDKLQHVVSYARTRRCRQLEILEYFGDPHRTTCGRCDHCNRRANTTESQDHIADHHLPVIRHAIRMILSGVARSRGRFGKQMIGQMLSGSKSAKVKKFGLNKLSTHGLLSELRQTEILDLLDQLIDVGLIEQVDVDRFRPVVRLTEVGRDVMRDEDQPIPSLEISPMLLGKLSGIVMSNAPAAETNSVSPPVRVEESSPPVAKSAPAVDESMLEILRIWRREVADATGIAPVRLLSDDSLQAIARTKPTDAAELSRITGWDSDLGAFYGPALLNVVAEQCSVPSEPAEPSAPEQNLVPTVDQPVEGTQANSHPDSFWTWKLFMAGFSFEDCQKIRRLPRERILLHLQEASEIGWEVKPSWFQ